MSHTMVSQDRTKTFAVVRYAILTVYRLLYSLVVLGNLAAFVVVVMKDNKLLTLLNVTAANLLASGLARQPLIINTMFLLVCSIPRSAPLGLRRIAAKVYHYGGVHSGCGIAALVWYIGFVGMFSKEYRSAQKFEPTILVLSYVILILLVAMILVAWPAFRVKNHDRFELTHRFGGWLVVILFWALLFLYAEQGREHQSMGLLLVNLPAFWFLVITTLAIIHPWLHLRRVRVKAEVVSPHVIRLHFAHTSVKFGQAISISKHPLRDWHAFATFPDSDDKSFSCLVSKAGDWTAGCIANPPTQLWVRSVPIYGFAYAMRMFQNMVVVTTGAGIGPCLSFLGDESRPSMRVLWQTKLPERTYGRGIIELVKRLDAEPTIIDTGRDDRQDMLPLVLNIVKEFGAEAVCVVSNPITTQNLVFELEARDVPAYGPIFDS